MLSQIERMFPTICSHMQIDIDQMVSARRHRGELFRKQYFDNHFWDIILIMYNYALQERSVDAEEIAGRLDLSPSLALRYIRVLHADGFVCAYEMGEDEGFAIDRDALALTAIGFKNAAAIIHRMHKIFA